MVLFIARLVLTVWAVLAFRLTLGPRLAIAGVTPDLAAALVFYLTISRGASIGIIGGFVMGLLLDVDRPEGLGISSLAWSTLALATAWITEAVDASDPIVTGVLLFLVVGIAETVRALCAAGPDLSRFALIWIRWALPTALYTGIATPVIVAAAHAILKEKRWLGGRA